MDECGIGHEEYTTVRELHEQFEIHISRTKRWYVQHSHPRDQVCCEDVRSMNVVLFQGDSCLYVSSNSNATIYMYQMAIKKNGVGLSGHVTSTLGFPGEVASSHP